MLLLSLSVPSLRMPPPPRLALEVELPENVLFVTVAIPWLKMPPPPK